MLKHRSQGLIRRLTRLGVPTLVVTALAACGGGPDAEAAPETDAPMNADSATDTTALNTLTEEERAQGWRLLFDGESFTGWRGLGIDSIPSAHWTIEDGAIKKIPSGDVPVQADGQPIAGGDLMTIETFGDFELAFDWKVSEGGNSGVKYNVSEELSMAHPPKTAALGFEYQILDDERHPDANAGVGGNRKAAGLYDLISAGDDKPLNPPGEWNHGRIVFRGNHGEHWLNGKKVLEYELGSPRMDSLLAASKYAEIEGFADRREGHIVLQDHNDAVWFRNIKIRTLD
ncbi:MAG TPA: DUF1080 domain-containing protein [Longimicrobiaceae bacterium]